MNPEPYIPVFKKIQTPQSISFSQLFIGLVSENCITIEEARNWRDRVSLPIAVLNVINTLPEDQKFIAETKAFAPSEVLRNDPLTIVLRFGLT